MDQLHEKQEKLKAYLADLGSLAVAFSGGVDSTYLVKVAHDVLGDQCIALTSVSEVNPAWEMAEAKAFCEREDIRQIVVHPPVLQDSAFQRNDKDRCYDCKKLIFSTLQGVAADHGIIHLAEGSNMDDNSDYRPGHRAIEELQVLSPLRTCELYKSEIRELSKELDLPTWSKPSFACLASRIPYGEAITAEKLKTVEQAELVLKELGFANFRVRLHGGNLARIEVAKADFPRLMTPEVSDHINDALHDLGIQYVTLDLAGYRVGSLNLVLSEEDLKA